MKSSLALVARPWTSATGSARAVLPRTRFPWPGFPWTGLVWRQIRRDGRLPTGLAASVATLLAAMLASVAPALALAQGPASLVETGIASIYAEDLEGRATASGQPYDGERLTAAHRTLPLGTRLRVTDAASGRSISVVVNDRWGGGPGRVLNLSRRAARELGLEGIGQLTVRVEVEQAGDSPSEEPRRPAAAPRERIPDRLENDAESGQAARCRNEGEILGLTDELLNNHVLACLARRPPKPRS